MIVRYYRKYTENYANVEFKITEIITLHNYGTSHQYNEYVKEIDYNIILKTDCEKSNTNVNTLTQPCIKNQTYMKEKWYISDCVVKEDVEQITLYGDCIIENKAHLPERYELFKMVKIIKNEHNLYKSVINTCLLCSKEKDMYSDYQICEDCFKLFFTLNKHTKKYMNDLDGYLKLLNKTGMWKKNGLPNNVSMPVFSGFIK